MKWSEMLRMQHELTGHATFRLNKYEINFDQFDDEDPFCVHPKIYFAHWVTTEVFDDFFSPFENFVLTGSEP